MGFCRHHIPLETSSGSAAREVEDWSILRSETEVVREVEDWQSGSGIAN